MGIIYKNDQASSLRKRILSNPDETKRGKGKVIKPSVIKYDNPTNNHELKLNRVIAVSSGKGGVGKSTFSVNFALALAKLGIQVTVLDADVGLANIDVMLGATPKYHLGHFFEGKKSLKDIVHQERGLNIIAGGSGIPNILKLQERKLDDFILGLSELESMTDVLVIDTGAGINKQILQIIKAADDAVIICTTEPTSMTDAYALIKQICINGIEKEIKCIINRAKDQYDADLAFKNLSLTVSKFLGIGLKFMGVIFEDQEVSASIKKQKPIVLRDIKTKAAKNILQVAEEYARKHNIGVEEKEEAETIGGVKGFFMRLIGR